MVAVRGFRRIDDHAANRIDGGSQFVWRMRHVVHEAGPLIQLPRRGI